MKGFIARAQQRYFQSWCVPKGTGEQGRLEQRGSVEELRYLCDGVFLWKESIPWHGILDAFVYFPQIFEEST